MTQVNHGAMTYGPAESKKDVLDTVKDKISDAATGAADMARTAKGKAAEFASDAKDKVEEWAGDAKDKVQEWAGEASDKVGNAVQEATALIRRYPIQAMLVGLGIGFLIARATTRD